MSDIPTGPAHGPCQYQLRICGHLASRWAGWFEGMTLTRHDDGTTVIEATVADQSALHGLLRKVHDLGVPLLSVTLTDPDPHTI